MGIHVPTNLTSRTRPQSAFLKTGATPALPQPCFQSKAVLSDSKAFLFQNPRPPLIHFSAATPTTYTHPKENDFIARLKTLATNPATKDLSAVKVSRSFSASGEEKALTFAELYESVKKANQGMRSLGLQSGDRIAIAETNTPEFITHYLAGLSLGATMVPINLLAMQDESDKVNKLIYMLEKPNAKALYIGADPLFKDMAEMGTIQKMQPLRKLLGPMIERYVDNRATKIFVIESLFRKVIERKIQTALNKQIKVSKAAGHELTKEQQETFLTQKRKNFQTIFEQLPLKIKLVTPQQQVKLRQLGPSENRYILEHPAPQSTADILYTSGTSGNPKGVNLTHQNLVFTVNSIAEGTRSLITKDDVTLMALPLFHIFGKAVFFSLLNQPSPIVFLPSLKKAISHLDKVVETIEEHQVTILPTVPIFVTKLLRHLEEHPEDRSRVQSLKRIISGGAPLKQDTFEKLQQLIPGIEINEGYGSSEGGINALNLEGTAGFVGTPLPGVEAKLGKSDELLVRSPGVASHYIQGTVPDDELALKDDDGWYHTGDVVKKEPKTNMFQIVDRLNETFKHLGELRSHADIEEGVKMTGLVNDVMNVTYLYDREHEPFRVAIVVTPDSSVDEAGILAAMNNLHGAGRISHWRIPDHVLVLHQKELPDGFDGFKRLYKVGRDFLEQAREQGIVTFTHEVNSRGWLEGKTTVNQEALDAFGKSYRWQPE